MLYDCLRYSRRQPGLVHASIVSETVRLARRDGCVFVRPETLIWRLANGVRNAVRELPSGRGWPVAELCLYIYIYVYYLYDDDIESADVHHTAAGKH